ncbi:hypothetical protein EDB81DRAFT_388201 [Dactylonectria macrodidyma]|uniref:Secreted protein n=1 Tax=Dactylonectria macrodidyma TaxID=307937 RepID=A0A9P9JDB3_9HYPO|nr:hypothetical protein EDB81DRAFT_388201 [Dactylonectria macrodidyma]
MVFWLLLRTDVLALWMVRGVSLFAPSPFKGEIEVAIVHAAEIESLKNRLLKRVASIPAHGLPIKANCWTYTFPPANDDSARQIVPQISNRYSTAPSRSHCNSVDRSSPKYTTLVLTSHLYLQSKRRHCDGNSQFVPHPLDRDSQRLRDPGRAASLLLRATRPTCIGQSVALSGKVKKEISHVRVICIFNSGSIQP